MNKILVTAIAASFLFMGQTCSTTDIPAIIASVQAATSKACAFVPSVETVLAIIAAKDSNVQSAAAIADAVCAAVKTKGSSQPMAGEPKVAGVNVEGYFVR